MAEGGAAGVALDLHQRALQQGWRHILCTVTAKAAKRVSAIKLSAGHQTYAADDRDGEHCLFRLFNRDLFGNFNELYRTILVHRVRWSCIFMCCTATG